MPFSMTVLPRRRIPRGLGRRALLQRSVGLALFVTGAWILKRVFLPRNLGSSEVESFAAFLDTLIPDGELPGARRTVRIEDLIRELRESRQKRRALVEGVVWLDRHAKREGGASFAALSYEQRERIVATLAETKEGTVPWFFYRFVRDRVMELHYSRAVAWKALGLEHPPQPRGYLDYWEASHA